MEQNYSCCHGDPLKQENPYFCQFQSGMLKPLACKSSIHFMLHLLSKIYFEVLPLSFKKT